MDNNKLNKKLIDRLKNGDMVAFDAFYKIYSGRLFGFVFSIIKQELDAEGIVQEVFIKIWESRHKIADYSTFESFLFSIAHNTTISLLRKRLNEKKYLEHLRSIQVEISSTDIIEEIHFNEIKEKFDHLINRLSPRQKEIYLLSREDGLTHKEIAEKLGISKNTVEIHMSKAIKFIKSNIDNTLLTSLLFAYFFIL
ncbi:MAG: RNA polymerase sigma-70 factor [Bacteroidetes bacterium]|nr:RNA polymerase sigma-70 factor [Bacteroidota bacterium]